MRPVVLRAIYAQLHRQSKQKRNARRQRGQVMIALRIEAGRSDATIAANLKELGYGG